MIGQGRPTYHHQLAAPSTRKVCCGLSGALLMVMVCAWAVDVRAAEEELRLRFAWGGGVERQWNGAVGIDRGTLSELRPLGIEADEPGSLWIEGSRIHVRQRSARTYDAFDVTVRADTVATLNVQLVTTGEAAGVAPLEVPLADLVRGVFNYPLDQHGNRLLVQRAPGDSLRVRLNRESLIFAPGETFSFGLDPQVRDVAGGTSLRIGVEVIPARETRAVWTREYDVDAPGATGPPLHLDVEVPVPLAEGAYDISITVAERTLRQRFAPVLPTKPLQERRVQFVVLSPNASPAPLDAGDGWRSVAEIDPSNPGWWKRMVRLPQLTLIPGWPQGPLHGGHAHRWGHPLGDMIRLAQPDTGTDTAWEAYPLPIDRVGAAHLLEIDYPSNVPQHLGVSIVEPNAAGAIMPIGLDSGFYIPAEAQTESPQMMRHRLIFWPKTKTPLVLLSRRGKSSTAVFSRLRVLTRGDRLPRAFARTQADERLLAGYLDRPLFPENFSATGVHDAWTGQTIDDWSTFYHGGTRLVDYLNHVGYNGLVLSVMADGSAIYPSELLQPTPRYDTGLLDTSGRDPLRKDVLELLFRVFDREGLRLIPALQFSAPLPQLETIRRRGGPESVGIEWVGADGATWLQRNTPERGLAPYYNPLDEHVQRAMLAVVRETLERYGSHPSLGGLALQLGAEGYAQLPGAEWGMDDRTVSRFQRDTQIQVPGGDGPDRFARRAQFLLNENRQAWLKWRAATMADFYRKMQAELAAVRPGAKLFLAGSGTFDGANARYWLQPTMPQKTKPGQVLLELGIDPDLYDGADNVVLLRPRRISPTDPLAARAVDLTIDGAVELERQLAASRSPGSLLFHPPQRLRLDSFERQSPVGPDKTYALLVSQPLPSGAWNRQRFVQSVASLDSQAIFDGGWLLPLGQEHALRRLIDVYRQLPPVRFETSQASRQPVTARVQTVGGETYVYLVNDSPWPVGVTASLDASPACTLAELGSADPPRTPSAGERGVVWKVAMQPFDLAAARLSQAGVQVTGIKVDVPERVTPLLDERINQLGARAAALANPPGLPALRNPDFELPPSEEKIPGWSLIDQRGAQATIDRQMKHGGSHAVQLTSHRQVASLASDHFDDPTTGRLAVSVWLRTEQLARQPVLRLALEGVYQGRTYYRFAPVGGTAAEATPLKNEWTNYIFQVDDLPTDGLEQVRVRFDLMGVGTVWIDDVQVYHLKFNNNERIELSKIVASARVALNSGALVDCLRLLDGYWPQFLEQHVAPPEVPLARSTTNPPKQTVAPAEPPATPGMVERIRGYVPKFLRF